MAIDGNPRRSEQTWPLGANVGVSSERGRLEQTWAFAANLGLCSEPRRLEPTRGFAANGCLRPNAGDSREARRW
jgi:hypothetical protein